MGYKSFNKLVCKSTSLAEFVFSGHFFIQNVGPQHDGDNSKVKVKVRLNIHGIFSVANASIIEKQNVESDPNDVSMDAELSSKNRNKDEMVCKLHVKFHFYCCLW